MNYRVDPTQVINYDRTTAELELWWLFSCVVAGKTASTQSRLLSEWLTNLPGESPFEKIRLLDQQGALLEGVKASRLGQYNRLSRMFKESLALDLHACTVEDLEAIHGCGPKTARMFLMMSRRNQRYAALDTHVLKYLASRGHTVPKATPPAGKLYKGLEEQFLNYADESGMPVADFDLSIWKSYSKN